MGNIKGLDKNNMPRSGDVMVYKKDTTLGQTREFDAYPGSGHPERDQGRLLAHRFCALRPLRVPHLEAQVEDGQGDRRQEDGGPPLLEVQRDGPVQLPASAAARLRHLQELRGFVPRRLHGWQWSGDARESGVLREEGGGCRWRQEEVRESGGITAALAMRQLLSCSLHSVRSLETACKIVHRPVVAGHCTGAHRGTLRRFAGLRKYP